MAKHVERHHRALPNSPWGLCPWLQMMRTIQHTQWCTVSMPQSHQPLSKPPEAAAMVVLCMLCHTLTI